MEPWSCTWLTSTRFGRPPSRTQEHHLHPGRCSLRDQQAVPSRRTSTSPPSTIAPYSSTRILLRVTSRARRFTSLARTGRPHWAVDGMVVTGKIRRAPDPSCSYYTVANIHINKECAKRRSVCSALLCLIRGLLFETQRCHPDV